MIVVVGTYAPRSGYALCLRPIIRVKPAAGDDPELSGEKNRPALAAGQTGEKHRGRSVVRPDIELRSGVDKALHRSAELRAEEPVHGVSQALYRPVAEPLLRHTAAARTFLSSFIVPPLPQQPPSPLPCFMPLFTANITIITNTTIIIAVPIYTSFLTS